MAGFESQDKARQVNSLLQYRRLSSNQRKSAYNRFREEVGRSPMAYSKEMLNAMYNGFESFSEEEKRGIINRLQLEDYERLNSYGQISK